MKGLGRNPLGGKEAGLVGSCKLGALIRRLSTRVWRLSRRRILKSVSGLGIVTGRAWFLSSLIVEAFKYLEADACSNSNVKI